MSATRQLFDVLVAGVLAIVIATVAGLAAPGIGTVLGILVASMFYFSRYPWGARDGGNVNEKIDAFYDAYLPV